MIPFIKIVHGSVRRLTKAALSMWIIQMSSLSHVREFPCQAGKIVGESKSVSDERYEFHLRRFSL